MMLREELIIESGGDEAFCSVIVEHSAVVAAVAFHFRFDSGMGDIEFTCLIFNGGDYLIEFRDIGDHGMYGKGVFGR